MKIRLIYVGKTSKPFLVEGVAEYSKRIERYSSLEIIEISDVKNAKKLSENEVKRQEGLSILQKIEANDFVALLDENGKEFTSIAFADFIQQRLNLGQQRLTFIIGGPYGFSQTVYERANIKIALSRLTFSHQMVRLFFLEQLYRSFTILKGEPYHHQ